MCVGGFSWWRHAINHRYVNIHFMQSNTRSAFIHAMKTERGSRMLVCGVYVCVSVKCVLVHSEWACIITMLSALFMCLYLRPNNSYFVYYSLYILILNEKKKILWWNLIFKCVVLLPYYIVCNPFGLQWTTNKWIMNKWWMVECHFAVVRKFKTVGSATLGQYIYIQIHTAQAYLNIHWTNRVHDRSRGSTVIAIPKPWQQDKVNHARVNTNRPFSTSR